MPLSAPVRKAFTAHLEEYSELGEDDPLWGWTSVARCATGQVW